MLQFYSIATQRYSCEEYDFEKKSDVIDHTWLTSGYRQRLEVPLPGLSEWWGSLPVPLLHLAHTGWKTNVFYGGKSSISNRTLLCI